MLCENELDVVVIGAGTAGLSAARRLAELGVTFVVVDQGPLGTTCARVGCMPSKALLHQGAEVAANHANAAPSTTTIAHHWQLVVATRDALAGAAATRARTWLGDRLIMGKARFESKHVIRVEDKAITAKSFIVATGSQSFVPQSFNALAPKTLTTDTLFDLPTLPKSVGIIGLGAIGLEIGLALSRLGIDVIGAESKAWPAGIVDPVIAKQAIERFSVELPMWLGRPVDAKLIDGKVLLSTGINSAQVDYVLLALGRVPREEQLDLDATGVLRDHEGRLLIDPQTLSSGDATNIYFAGDVSNKRPLMHEAVYEGKLAAQLAAKSSALHERWPVMNILFSDPDLANAGLTYDQLSADEHVIGTATGASNGRSKILQTPDNIVRVYAERRTGAIVGASLLTVRGEHLCHLLAWAIQRRETIASLLELPFYHPTIEELIQSALMDARAKMSSPENQ